VDVGIQFALDTANLELPLIFGEVMKDSKSNSNETHLVTVYTVNDSVKAELIKNMLADHKIKAELGGEHQAGFTGTLAVEIITREIDAASALEFIKIHFPES
jgi:hypothetical protein